VIYSDSPFLLSNFFFLELFFRRPYLSQFVHFSWHFFPRHLYSAEIFLSWVWLFRCFASWTCSEASFSPLLRPSTVMEPTLRRCSIGPSFYIIPCLFFNTGIFSSRRPVRSFLSPPFGYVGLGAFLGPLKPPISIMSSFYRNFHCRYFLAFRLLCPPLFSFHLGDVIRVVISFEFPNATP